MAGEEENSYEEARTARIARNKAMLASLGVRQLAEKVAEPLRKAQQDHAAGKEANRQAILASVKGPTRRSSRSAAAATLAKLQSLVNEGNLEDSSEGSDKEAQPAASRLSPGQTGPASSKRKRGAVASDDEEYDAASDQDEAVGSAEYEHSDSQVEDSEPEEDDEDPPDQPAYSARPTLHAATATRAAPGRGQRSGGAGKAQLAAGLDMDADEMALQQALAMSMSGVGLSVADKAASIGNAGDIEQKVELKVEPEEPGKPAWSLASDAHANPYPSPQQRFAAAPLNPPQPSAAPPGNQKAAAPGPKPAPKARKAAAGGRGRKKGAGVPPPTADEIQQAFCMLDPYDEKVITRPGMQQVCREVLGEWLEDAEVEGMMQFAAGVCGCTPAAIDFDSFHILVNRYMKSAEPAAV